MNLKFGDQRKFGLLKLITYLVPSISLILGSRPDNLILLIIGLTLLFANSYFRQYFLSVLDNQIFGKLSMIIELVLATLIIALTKNNISILFYMVIIVESNISYSLLFAALISSLALMSGMALVMLLDSGDNILKTLVDAFSSMGIAMLFTFLVSYSLKVQINEKQKAERANQELELAYKKLLDNAAKMQELSVEKERTRMAREIHDTLAHTLTALVVQMEASKRLIDVDIVKAKEELGKAQELTRSGLNDVKRTIKALRPQMLENNSFKDAVSNLINDLIENTGSAFEINVNMNDEVKIPLSMEIVLFRVIQESITNSIRHGKAKKVRINLSCENNIIHLNIEDNGNGCSSVKKGFGLQGITERIESINGTVNFLGIPCNGFKTSIYIPLEIN